MLFYTNLEINKKTVLIKLITISTKITMTMVGSINKTKEVSILIDVSYAFFSADELFSFFKEKASCLKGFVIPPPDSTDTYLSF